MSEFYKRLADKEAQGKIDRFFASRPENLHDYQGCANDPNMVKAVPSAEPVAPSERMDRPTQQEIDEIAQAQAKESFSVECILTSFVNIRNSKAEPVALSKEACGARYFNIDAYCAEEKNHSGDHAVHVADPPGKLSWPQVPEPVAERCQACEEGIPREGMWHIVGPDVKVVCPLIAGKAEPVAEDRTGAGIPVLLERIAQIAAHRACCSEEHDPANGKIHGYCVVCGIPWPCEYAGIGSFGQSAAPELKGQEDDGIKTAAYQIWTMGFVPNTRIETPVPRDSRIYLDRVQAEAALAAFDGAYIVEYPVEPVPSPAQPAKWIEVSTGVLPKEREEVFVRTAKGMFHVSSWFKWETMEKPLWSYLIPEWGEITHWKSPDWPDAAPVAKAAQPEETTK